MVINKQTNKNGQRNLTHQKCGEKDMAETFQCQKKNKTELNNSEAENQCNNPSLEYEVTK